MGAARECPNFRIFVGVYMESAKTVPETATSPCAEEAPRWRAAVLGGHA